MTTLHTTPNTSTTVQSPVKKQKATISSAERQRRLTAWEEALANFALENIHPTEEMKRIGFMYIDGEIGLEEQGQMMRASILAN